MFQCGTNSVHIFRFSLGPIVLYHVFAALQIAGKLVRTVQAKLSEKRAQAGEAAIDRDSIPTGRVAPHVVDFDFRGLYLDVGECTDFACDHWSSSKQTSDDTVDFNQNSRDADTIAGN